MAFWSCAKKNTQQVVTNVMQSSLSIQEKYDNFKVGEDLDINLRMKIAISIDDVFIYHLGMMSWFVFVNILCLSIFCVV